MTASDSTAKMISDRGRQRLLLADECFHGLPGDVNGQQVNVIATT